ncbi:MAG: methyltransferase domain-containing protein [Hyphomicrobium aestuarii]|nr:methyltransferase domain-containing protein [Hyphomicrobium aestuarii]
MNSPPKTSTATAAGVPQIFDRATLLSRRERASAQFAQHAFLLDRVADDLAERLMLVKRQFENGLSIEAYDGRVSRVLRSCPNVSRVTDAEPSPAMRAMCRDEASPSGLGEPLAPLVPYDLVVSALSLHMVDDLPGALVLLRQAMSPDGLLLAAVLGGETLHELRQSWLVAEEEVTGGASPRVAPFADVRALGGLLQRAGFALPVADSERVTVTYATPLHLMRELKGMGASNMLADRRRVPVTRTLLMRATEVYVERFGLADGRIPATFEIVTLTAWVPHESQPKPLQPGSATARLADVLGVKENKA